MQGAVWRMNSNKHGLSGVVRTEYKRCGEIHRAPARVFDWTHRKEEATTTKRTCIFFFHNATGEKIPVYTSLASTLLSVKEEISKIMSTPANHIRLSWYGHCLVDSRTLVSYGISHGHCLHLSCSIRGSVDEGEDNGLPSPRRLMPLTVYLIDDSDLAMGTRLRVLARMYDKVFEVKLLLEAQTGIPAGYMRLTMGGRPLANEHSLIECGVRDSAAVLQLVCVFGSTEMSTNDLMRNTRCAKPGTAIEGLEFQVTVKQIWSGKRRHLGITTDTTIRMLKELVVGWSGIELEKQIVLHRGRILTDDLTASYYNLESGSFIDLAIMGGVKAKVCTSPESNTGRGRTVAARYVETNAGGQEAEEAARRIVAEKKSCAEKYRGGECEAAAKFTEAGNAEVVGASVVDQELRGVECVAPVKSTEASVAEVVAATVVDVEAGELLKPEVSETAMAEATRQTSEAKLAKAIRANREMLKTMRILP